MTPVVEQVYVQPPNTCIVIGLSVELAPDGGMNYSGILSCNSPLGYRIVLKRQVQTVSVIEESDYPNKKLFLYHQKKQDLDKFVVIYPK